MALINKDFWFSFNLPLAGYPAAGKVSDYKIFSEPLPDGTAVLVYGKYDLIFCYQKEDPKPKPAQETEVITRTFCLNIPLVDFEDLEPLTKNAAVKADLAPPVLIRIRPVKPTNLRLFDLIRGTLLGKTWVEVLVEGKIIAEVVPQKAGPADQMVFIEAAGEKISAKKQPSDYQQKELDLETGAFRAVRESGSGVIDLEKLAELVMKIIRQREGEKASESKPSPSTPATAAPLPAAAGPARAAASLDVSTATRTTASTVTTGSSPAGTTLTHLSQIPSRPGLSQTFVQPSPPLRPPGKG